MPRKPRDFEVGRIYHIVNRGVEKRKIYRKSQDYSRFVLELEFANDERSLNLWNLLAGWREKPYLVGTDPTRLLGERIEEQRKKSQKPIIELLTFTLMPNHYHFVIREIREGGISLFMRKLGGYSTYFNKQYSRIGALFQSRFVSVPIQNDIQLHTVFAYVHTNPVELIEPRWKERIIRNPSRAFKFLEDYKWSSYRDYTGQHTFPTVTNRDFFLNFFGGEEKCKEIIKEWIIYKIKNTKFGPEVID